MQDSHLGRQRGEFLRRARQKAGFKNQSALATELGISQSTIVRMEQGLNVSLLNDESKCTTLASVLGITVDQIASPPWTQAVERFCPNFECIGSESFVRSDGMVVFPDFPPPLRMAEYCRFCGTRLATACSNIKCGAPPTRGMFCIECKTPYVPIPSDFAPVDLGPLRKLSELRNREYRRLIQKLEIEVERQ